LKYTVESVPFLGRFPFERDARQVALGQSVILSTLTLQITTAQNQLADIGRKIDAAKGNQQLINSLKTQAAVAQEQLNGFSKQLVVATVPALANELDSLSDRWSTENETLGKPGREGARAVNQVTLKWLAQARPSMVMADSLRQQLLLELPPSDQTQERNRSETAIFANAISTQIVDEEKVSANDLKTAAQYLRDLSNRVATLINSH